jgi:FimV-like protein
MTLKPNYFVTTLLFAALAYFGYYYYNQSDPVENSAQWNGKEQRNEATAKPTTGDKHVKPKQTTNTNVATIVPVKIENQSPTEPLAAPVTASKKPAPRINVQPKEVINGQIRERTVIYTEDNPNSLGTLSSPEFKQTDPRPEPKPNPEPKVASISKHKPATIPGEQPRSDTEKGYEHFENKDWQGALNNFQKQMGASDPALRHEAALMAARSYEKMGKTEEAIKLLSTIIAEDGPQKRAARKLLRKLRNESEEE